MPFLRTPKGVKMPFSSAKVAEIITVAYREVYGKNSFRYRGDINQETDDIVTILENKYGALPDSEWLYFDILEIIRQSLSKNTKRMEVYNAYLDFYEHETQIKEKPKKLTTQFKKRSAFDPAWNIYIKRPETEEEFKEKLHNYEKQGKDSGHLEIKEKRVQINLRRSLWKDLWVLISNETKTHMNIEDFNRYILKHNDTISLDVDDWFDFWKKEIFVSMNDDLRFYGLLSAMEIRELRYNLMGGHWLSFSPLNLETQYEDIRKVDIDLFSNSYIKSTYGFIWKQFISMTLFADDMRSDLLQNFNIDKLADSLEPERDSFIDWRALQNLKQSGSLLPISTGTQWIFNKKIIETIKPCFELPQWAYMRLAIALASVEKPELQTDKAIEFYNAFSLNQIIPTATMLREAGKILPDYLEDKASIVADKYENIWESINETAIGTKWTGTVSLDWREVRATNSPINNGVRVSKGILPFLETINTSLKAQDRNEYDKPVTNAIPLWHLDSILFLFPEKYKLDKFHSVLILPDIFMDKARNAEMWTFFDPKIFPEILSKDKNAYLLAESKIKERQKKYPKSFKQKRADKILFKLLNNMSKGSININFESNNVPFNLFNKTLSQVNGVEGVGSFVVHNNEEKGANLFSHWASWPSAVVNIAHILDNKGVPNANKMKSLAKTALRILDNAIILSQKEEYDHKDEKSIMKNRDINNFRHICLGLIGLQESIQILSNKQDLNSSEEINDWLKVLISSWEVITLREEQYLLDERGYADIFQKQKDFFDPIKAIEEIKTSREGSFGLKLSDDDKKKWKGISDRFKKTGHRFISKTIFAPFSFSSSIAGVVDGGLGIVSPADKVYDDHGNIFWVPTPLLLSLAKQNTKKIKEYSSVIKYPNDFKKWDSDILKYSHPSPEDWRDIIYKASIIRPWFDLGVCLTLPIGMDKSQLNNLLYQSWFYGISSIRFVSRLNMNDEELKDKNELLSELDDFEKI